MRVRPEKGGDASSLPAFYAFSGFSLVGRVDSYRCHKLIGMGMRVKPFFPG